MRLRHAAPHQVACHPRDGTLEERLSTPPRRSDLVQRGAREGPVRNAAVVVQHVEMHGVQCRPSNADRCNVISAGLRTARRVPKCPGPRPIEEAIAFEAARLALGVVARARRGGGSRGCWPYSRCYRPFQALMPAGITCRSPGRKEAAWSGWSGLAGAAWLERSQGVPMASMRGAAHRATSHPSMRPFS